ncbi:glycoside hydrolase family 43 protein [Archangium primigenium]|uniref:glycoside hydrolase family 43 protein n=1 Tax=[Archangium] primigenium TaxID=2792470 RepID=UPI00195E05F1|nr:glycoside hydrolase family 43 protein [Archangium primigenium]MBM7116380.1 glycoside hydrolase family 43 protein [Archangium primigenium]
MRVTKALGVLALSMAMQACGGPEPLASEAGEPLVPDSPLLGSQEQALGRLNIRNADPTVIRVGSTYISAETDGSRLYVRTATSVDGLGGAARQQVWSNPSGWAEVWAPQIIRDSATGTYYIYFTAGANKAHRMYVIQSKSPTSGWSTAQRMSLPDDKWAIDGTAFKYRNQWYFVWSGWVGDSDGEQTLFLARMSSPTTVTGARFVISQPREAFEKVEPNPPCRVNEGPEVIIDPAGQLHVVYSANGSWGESYCLADLRLKLDGDPTYVWDWFKSNGCLFGANRSTLMSGWDPTLYAKGVGHHSFVLVDGDPNTSPPAGPTFPLAYHGVAKNEYPSDFWGARYWYSGTFQWWGNITYTRGSERTTGWSLKFYE